MGERGFVMRVHDFGTGTKSLKRRFSGTIAAAALALTFLCSLQEAQAQATVFLDYTNFSTRLSSVATSAGINAFTGAEETQIKAGILSQLQTAYAGFTVNFVETAPVSGNFQTIRLGATTSTAGLLGLASRIDFRNLNLNDTADIYTANFAFIVDEFSGGTNRVQQLSQLTTALANTTAHELGHNCGLEHCDCYATPGITPSNYNNTGGVQNQHIMSTGPTGISEAGREQPLTFNRFEKAKLSYAQGFLATTPTSIIETAAVHNTAATAQAISFTNLSVAGVLGANVLGSISAANQLDFYRFSGVAGQQLTMHLISDSLSDRYANVLDGMLALFDSGGTSLFNDDDIEFTGTAFNTNNAADNYSLDTMLVNFTLPTTGDYFIRASGFGTDTGNYELFSILTPVPASVVAPEPGSLCLMVILLPVLRRRRSSKR
jgi:hypothetical protein